MPSERLRQGRVRSATTETAPTRIALIAIALLFFALFLLLPLVLVFAEAFRGGLGGFVKAIADPDAQAAIRLTVLIAAIAVPVNMIFGIAAAWAVAKHEFKGKSVFRHAQSTVPFSVSPVIAGLVYVLLFGAHGVISGHG